jgi:hypothetical protein
LQERKQELERGEKRAQPWWLCTVALKNINCLVAERRERTVVVVCELRK